MDTSIFTNWVGMVIGSLMIGVVLFVYVRHQKFGIAGWTLTSFGVILLGLSVWKTVEISAGGLSAKFQALNEKVAALDVKNVEVWAERNPEIDHTAEQSGFVLVMAEANRGDRNIIASGFIEGEKMASIVAHDLEGVKIPSILSNSFMMPIPKGKTWKVEIIEGKKDSVKIRWFSQTAMIERKDK